MTHPLQHLVPAIFSVFVLSSCGGPAGYPPAEQTPSSVPPPGPPGARDRSMMGDHATHCPMEVPGATVTVDETEAGAALTFTTTGDIDELRRRARGMAEMHGRMGEMHGGMMSGMGSATVSVEDIDGGARLEFATSDPGQRAAMREHLRQMAQSMGASGTCPMMAQ